MAGRISPPIEAARHRRSPIRSSGAAAANDGRLRLERATESRERLMRGIGHDLKNPLNAIDGHAQLLKTGYAVRWRPSSAKVCSASGSRYARSWRS